MELAEEEGAGEGDGDSEDENREDEGEEAGTEFIEWARNTVNKEEIYCKNNNSGNERHLGARKL